MKKYKMLGVNTERLTCCILECLLPYDKIINEDIEASDFTHYSTNWNGCDSIPRTLSYKNLKQTGRKFKLKNKISFNGTDADMGHYYNWTFTIDEIRELE